MKIRMAEIQDLEEIQLFYKKLTEDMASSPFHPGWKQDIYPSFEMLEKAVTNREMQLGIIQDEIVSGLIVNHEAVADYQKVAWKVAAETQEILVLHAFGTAKKMQGQGVSKKMLAYTIQEAQKAQIKTLRLDVLPHNLPAQKLYQSMGFQYLETLPLFYEDTGVTDFLLYEYPL